MGVLEGTDKIIGDNTEDVSLLESTVYFDIRFAIYVGENSEIKILFDVEAQKNFYPGYNIVTRGIVYGARMISSQIGKEFDLKHYDDVKKVYSIWVCFDVPKKIGNAISCYSIQKEDIIPGIPDIKEAYDKISVVIMCLDEEKTSTSKAINMLNTLFSETKSSDEIKAELENEYNIPMDDGYGKEIDVMCNLSGRVYDTAFEWGALKTLIELVRDKILTTEAAAKRASMSEDEFKKRMKEWEEKGINK